MGLYGRCSRWGSCRGLVPRSVLPTCPLPRSGGGDFAVRRNRRGFPAAPLPPPSLRFGAGTFPSRGDRHAPVFCCSPRRGSCRGLVRRSVLPTCPLPRSGGGGPQLSLRDGGGSQTKNQGRDGYVSCPLSPAPPDSSPASGRAHAKEHPPIATTLHCPSDTGGLS